jgi:hypothetical protein
LCVVEELRLKNSSSLTTQCKSKQVANGISCEMSSSTFMKAVRQGVFLDERATGTRFIAELVVASGLESPYDNVHDGLPCPGNGHDGDGTDSIVGGPNGSLMTPASSRAISYSTLVPVPARSRVRSSSEVLA